MNSGSVSSAGDLHALSIAEQAKLIRNRELSALELTRYYLDRIEALDRNGPGLNSVLEINPDAEDIAREIDNGQRYEGVLAGIPILLKGNIDTADRMETTAGSLALEGNMAAEDAEIVSRLREAGAVILGKTNLSEWANFRSTRSSSGWSSRGGQTRNPYILDRNPCGSSSGSGVAVAAGLCSAAVGTETDGSIICPSSANGVVGIKPTVGLLGSRGIIPISHSQDTAGPMARSVEDAVLLLYGLSDGFPGLSFRQAVGSMPEDLSGFRIGVVRNFFGGSDKVDSIIEGAVCLIRDAGAEIQDVQFPVKGKYDDAEMEVMLYEFKDGINRYLSACNVKSGVQSLSDLIAFNSSMKETVMPWFGQEILEMAEKKGPLTDRRYKNALRKCRKLTRRRGLDRPLQGKHLHALVAPSGGPAWKTDWINGDHFSIGSSSPAAVSGYPNITVPAGSVHGLPVGISFLGNAYSELTLAGIASVFEKLRGPMELPRFRLS